MVKKLFFSSMLAVAAVMSVNAEVIANYTEQFEGPSVRPKAWMRGGASSSYSMATMTLTSEGGHNGGYMTVVQAYGTTSNTPSTYYNNNYSYNDLLVTPAVEGEVSIWVRQNGAKPSLTFYEIPDPTNVTTNAKELVRLNGVINLIDGVDVTDWTKITVEDVPAGTYLGIRANCLDIDEFTAESAELVYRPGLVLGIDRIGGTTLTADENNEITLSFKVTIENTGDIDFPASEEGFQLEVFNASNGNTIFGTCNIPDAIDCGVKLEREFSIIGQAETKNANYRVKVTHELTNSQEVSIGSYTVIPYLPAPKLMFFEDNTKNQNSYTDVNAIDMITIGAGSTDVSRTLYLWNEGTKTLDVTSIDLTEGFACDIVAPFTIESKATLPITISLTGEAGVKNGTITFNDATLGAIKYDLQGLLVADDVYTENFESGNAAGIIVGNYWSVKDVPAALKTLAGEKYIETTQTGTTANNRIITPLLTFAEGDAFSFMATKSDNTSSELKVLISTDRENWTEAATINTKNEDKYFLFNNDKPTGSGYGTYEWRIYNVEMPAGDYYVAFQAGKVRLDNLMGGKLKEVAHDIYTVATGLPENGMVNTRYAVNITLRNILAEAETDYQVVLNVDGEDVATAAETPEMTSGTDIRYDLVYTPHTEGEHEGTFAFVAGDDRIDLASFTFNVVAESANNTVQIGVEKINTTDPLSVFYNTQAQILYRANDLNFDNGAKIAGFHYNGYNTSREVTKHVKIWIGETEVDKFDEADIQPIDRAGLTLVYNHDYTFEMGGTTSQFVPMFDVTFDTPYVYNGGNLVVMVEQSHDEDEDGANIYFRVDNSAYDYWKEIFDNRVIENKQEYADDFEDEPKWSVYRAGYPVTYFNLAKDIVIAKGNVTDDFGAAIEGAVVSFTSDNILYTATTDEAGAYEATIMNPQLTYILTGEHVDFDTYTKDEVTFSADEPEAVNNFAMDFADRTATLTGVVTNLLEANAPIEGAVITITSEAGHEDSVTTDADGAYTLVVPELKHDYTMTVHYNESKLAEEVHTFAAKSDVHHFSVGYSMVEGIGIDNAAVEYYNLQGVKVTNPRKGETYIIRRGETATKQLLR